MERLEFLHDKVKNLPLEPGVYIMRDKSNKIIYIGKAKALRNRVGSYFRNIEKHFEKVFQMVMNVYDFDYIVTESEFEALVLECSLIKQYNPKYNILLKDGKGYHYIKIFPREYGKISAVMQRTEDDAIYLGPYISSFVVRETAEQTNKIFNLPTCSKKFPSEIGKGRPCLNYYIKKCAGLCRGKISKEEYQSTISQAIDFMKNGSTMAIETLNMKMLEASENLEFEKAADYRNKMYAISKITEHQKVVFAKVAEQDVIALAQISGETCVAILKFRGERLIDKEDFLLGSTENAANTRSEFILRYYHDIDDIPKQISLDGECDDVELIEKLLSEKSKHKVKLMFPKRGEQSKIIDMAQNNAAQKLSHQLERTGKEVAALDELARLLGMKVPPKIIEAFDISNIGSDTIVGGMVVFHNARPFKAAYKRFSVKNISTPDDYASMREVVSRRLQHIIDEKDIPDEKKSHFGRIPDLILLDGGKGHVGVVVPIVKEFGLDIPIFGMVKDDKHKTRAIAVDGGEISIISTRKAFTLISQIQEEVHRFSIRYSKSKHQKNAFELSITKIPGIGQARAQELFKHFKTIHAMRSATVEEIAAVKRMNTTCAKALYEHFNPITENE